MILRPNFDDKLRQAQAACGCDRALLMQPKLTQMPLPMQKYDDPFLPFGKAIVDATRDLLCAYIFDLGAYLAIGAAGAVALERTIAYANTNNRTVTILHAPFVGESFVDAAGDAAFNVDAVTINAKNDDSGEVYRQHGLGVLLVTGKPLVQNARIKTAYSDLEIRVLGADVLYAGRGENFAEQVRAAVEA